MSDGLKFSFFAELAHETGPGAKMGGKVDCTTETLRRIHHVAVVQQAMPAASGRQGVSNSVFVRITGQERPHTGRLCALYIRPHGEALQRLVSQRRVQRPRQVEAQPTET